MDSLAAFFDHGHRHVRPYAGQVEPAFQQTLRDLHAGVRAEDCHFYHTLVLGDGTVVPGGWDMRGLERNYLGHVDYRGRSVLEFGPASGYLSFWMEEQGAAVTVVDLPPDFPPDLVPLPGIDLAQHARNGAETARQVRNSWWYAHRRRNSNARAVYADIYRLPADLGRYEISTFGSILLHLGQPFVALQEAARVTDRAIIVTDLVPDVLYGTYENSFLEINPGNEPGNLVNWWRFFPGAMAKMLRILGFPFQDLHFFPIAYHPEHRPDLPPIQRFMYTLVAQREAGLLPRLEKTPPELELDREIRAKVPALSVEQYNEAHRRLHATEVELSQNKAHVQKLTAELQKVYRSVPWKLTKPWRMLFGF